MNIGHLLFSYNGRINRAKFWLGNLFILVIGILNWFVVSQLVGGMMLETAPAGAPTDMLPMRMNPQYILISSLIGLASAYISFCVAAKRCHDRAKSAWWLTMFVPGYLLSLYNNFLIYAADGDVMKVASSPETMWIGLAASILSLPVLIWWLVDLGILEGTKGPNQYGPDPLGRA